VTGEGLEGPVKGEGLVSFEDVAGVDFSLDIIEGAVVAVGDDGLGEGFELGEVVDDEAAEEGGAVFERGFVDDDLGTLGLHTLHDTLDAGLAEVVGVGLHGEAIDANGALALCGGIEITTVVVVVIAGFLQHLIGNEVLAGAVGLDDGGHHVLRHGGVVRQELLGVLGQAVAAITEGGVVIVGANTGVQTDAIDDGLGVESLHLGIGVELVEVADAKSQIGICKEFNGFCLFHAHKQTRDALVEV